MKKLNVALSFFGLLVALGVFAFGVGITAYSSRFRDAYTISLK